MSASALTFSTNSQSQRVIRHAWPRDAPRCRAIQPELTQHIVTHDDFGPVTTLGGIDIGFEDGGQMTRAAAAVLDADTLEIIEQALVRTPTRAADRLVSNR